MVELPVSVITGLLAFGLGWNFCGKPQFHPHVATALDNWASEASPTLGCSIEISCDIYLYVRR